MKKQRRLSVFALFALLSIGAFGCGGSGGDFNLISVQEEWQLGDQLSQDIARQVRINNDPQLNAYINQLGQRIVARTPMANMPWKFHVVDDPAINAFAIPGGHVYINTGLIANSGSASELAGVMAHEISHVIARHSTEQMSRQYGLSIVAGLVLGQNPGALSEIAAQIIAGGALARFSREAEREADELGIRFMAEAGYNPAGMAAMFRTLMAQQQRQPSSVEQFFSTHPTTEERVRDSEKRAQQIGNRGITDEPEFQAIKRRA
jgi:predicted Zn-dependent protease